MGSLVLDIVGGEDIVVVVWVVPLRTDWMHRRHTRARLTVRLRVQRRGSGLVA